MTALEVVRVGHGFGARRVLDEVSFSVEPGSFTVLAGPNGAGKTTLFSLVAGLYRARSGTIRVFGHDLRHTPVRALAGMGIVFQQPTLDLDLTAAENLRYHAALHGLSVGEANMRAGEELERLGVVDRRAERVRALSGGQRRRVEIARALMHRPRLLLLDEPTTGLDPAGRKALLAHVRDLGRERGIAVLWATHLLDEAEAGDAAVILHRGRVRAAGRVEALAGEAGAASFAAAFAALTEQP